MNRSQRRAKITQLPAAPEPQIVGQLTISEANEIRGRRQIADRLEQQATDLAVAANAVRVGVDAFVNDSLRVRSLAGQFRIDDAGNIWGQPAEVAPEPDA